MSASHDPLALAARLRPVLAKQRHLAEKRMFGGVCFMLGEHMLCGAGKPGYMFRVGKKQYRRALERKGARAMDFNGRSFEGFVWVDPRSCDARALRGWIALARRYVAALPPKAR
jgi:hypothetical protein